MKRRGPPERVEDLEAGQYVRLAAGVFRVTNRIHGSQRWLLLLDEHFAEVRRGEMWFDGDTKIVEVLQAPEPARAVGGESVDPADPRGAA